jgi:predicted Zn-dependent peptidase
VAQPELWVGYLIPGRYSQNVGNNRLVASPATEERLRELLETDPDVVEVNLVPLHDRLATILAIQVVLSSDKRRDEVARLVQEYMEVMWRPVHASLAKAVAASIEPIPVRVGNRYMLVRLTPEFYTQVKAEQLLRLRFKGIADAVNELEPWTERALDRAGYLQVMGKPGALMWATQQATLMEEQAVSEFASQFLTPDRSRVAYVDPLPGDRRPRAGRTGVADRPIADDKALGVDYGDPFVAPAPPELASAHQVRLDNGLTVAIIKRGGFPAVSAALAFAGGSAASDPPGAVELLRWMEKRAGAALPLNAVETEPIDGPTFTGDMVRAGTRNLSNALYLLAQRIVDTDKTDWAEVLDNEAAQGGTSGFRIPPGEMASRLLRQSLYGSHPLARSTTVSDVRSVRGAQMERWIPRMRSPRNAFLVMVGNVEPARGEQLARTWFGSWQGQKDAVPATLPPVLPPPGRPGGIEAAPMVVDRDGDTQVELVLACRLPPADARAQARQDLLATVLGSHVNTMVRHRAGAAYSVQTINNFRGGGGADVMISMDIETRRLPEALAALRALWKRLGDDGFDAGTVSQARWAVTAGQNLRYQTASELARALVQNWSLGWPVESLTRYPEILRTTTPAELSADFRTCRDNTVTLVMGEKKVVDPLLASGR